MSEHRITAEIGEGLKVDIAYSYVPGAKPSRPTAIDGGDPGYPAELELLSATVVTPDDAYNQWTPVYVRELADNWLQDEGYEMACEHAERDRHGDHE